MVISLAVSYVEEVSRWCAYTSRRQKIMKATPHQWSGHLMLNFPRRKERVT
jgi:hypothetical protein